VKLGKKQNRNSLNIKNLVQLSQSILLFHSHRLSRFEQLQTSRDTERGEERRDNGWKRSEKNCIFILWGGTKIPPPPRFELPQEFKYTNHKVILHALLLYFEISTDFCTKVYFMWYTSDGRIILGVILQGVREPGYLSRYSYWLLARQSSEFKSR
jgi:hypothetical protein